MLERWVAQTFINSGIRQHGKMFLDLQAAHH
jgi:hypothetical protein